MNEFLQREHNLLISLVQIYKQLIKFNSTKEGQIQLNKKLCVIESIKFYVENLILFNDCDLILPAKAHSDSSSELDTFENQNPTLTNNLLNEIQTSLKNMFDKWAQRRKGQDDFSKLTDADKPYNYLIDSFFDECKLYANVSKLFTKQEEQNEESLNTNVHIPKSFLELLEICLECNISTQMKQIIILYILYDMANSDISGDLHKNISKLISFSSNSSLSQSFHKSSESGIEKDISISTSYILDLAYVFYLIDSHQIENAFKYLKSSDLSFLELFEKNYVLNNAVYLKEFKTASEYLWLFKFQIGVPLNTRDLFNDSRVDKSLTGSDSSLLSDSKSFVDKTAQREYIMHQKLIITIYLSNR